MKVLKGIGLGLTCICKGIYESNERERVRVNMHPEGVYEGNERDRVRVNMHP